MGKVTGLGVQSVNCFGHNVRGLSDEKLEEVVEHMKRRRLYVYVMQETWRVGDFQQESDGFLFINHGHPERRCNRGSGGVGFVLSPNARLAWEAAGSKVMYYGERIVAIKLKIPDASGREVDVMMASAYAPIGASPVEERETFLAELAECENACGANEVWAASIDANASLGTRRDDKCKVLGPAGNTWVNKAGRLMYQTLAENRLVSCGTFFLRKEYNTWSHPGRRTGYSLDHWLMRRGDLKRIERCQVDKRLTVDSDHRPMLITIRISKRRPGNRLRRPQDGGGGGGGKGRERTDRRILLKPEGRDAFVNSVVKAAEDEYISCVPRLFDPHTAARPEISEYELLNECLTLAASEALTGSGDRVRAAWFAAFRDLLVAAIDIRNAAQARFNKDPSRANKTSLRAARTAMKWQVKQAKEAWLEERVEAMNTGKGPEGTHDPRTVWKMVGEIKNGCSTWKAAATVRLKKADGTWCDTTEENAMRFMEHFGKVLNIETSFDPDVLELVEQRPMRPELDEVPLVGEVEDALRQVKSGKASGDSKVPAEFLKALRGSTEGMALLMGAVEAFWLRDVTPEEFNSLRLKTLPKSGDLSNVGKWRGIYLMDIVCKVISKVMERRLNSILLEHGMEAQNGFMGGRGTTDGIFLLYQALLKRREHQQDSFVLLIDLIKAFPGVSRELMYSVLAKFGVPPHLVELIRRLHTGVVAKLTVGSEDKEMPCTSGTKQGDPLAAILFLFVMQACLETLDLEGVEFQTPAMGTAGTGNRMPTGAPWKTKRGWDAYRLWCSLYADDAGIIFPTRAALQEGTQKLYSHFVRFGLSMHVGRKEKDKVTGEEVFGASKTEAMFFPGAGKAYTAEDTSLIWVDGTEGIARFTKSFKYLGSLLVPSLSSTAEVDKRLTAAGGAFGALRKCVFGNKDISYRVQGKVYQALILSILLYGSECWTLGSADRSRIVRFHRRCVRTICRVNLRMTMQGRIKTKTLLQRCGCQTMDYYINVRCLRWAGHLVRMPRERLPRQLFFSKVCHVRKLGGQFLTYGARVQREVDKAMEWADATTRRKMTGRRGVGWMKYAGSGVTGKEARDVCRARWRAFIRSGRRVEPAPRRTGRAKAVVDLWFEAGPIPIGAPVMYSQSFNHWYNHQQEWMGGLTDAAQYARFCVHWAAAKARGEVV